MTTSAVETPSGKTAADENFPVGSWLLPARLRAHVARFYRFARAIDDIADNPDLTPEDKIARLDRFAGALEDCDDADPALATAQRLRDSLKETGVTARHALDLIAAFKQDAVKDRYHDWDDLMGYCALSANPVGRYLLDLHGENPAGYPASDALCSSLQILNHLQDCQEDYRDLGRVYLPQPWLKEQGLDVEVLDARQSPPGLRRVIDRCLEGCDRLNYEAATLPGRLKSRGLAMESEVIHRLACRLTGRLRNGDPLAARVALSKSDFVIAGVLGVGAVTVKRLLGGAP